MWNPLTKKQLELIPKLYSQEGVPFGMKKVYAKFFIGSFTWYVIEYDPKQDIFFAFVVSPSTQGMEHGGEFGYVSHKELKSIRVPPGIEVDRDLHMVKPRKPRLLIELLKEDNVI